VSADLIALIASALKIDLPLDADTPLISSGIIDSFRVATLVAALEAHYGVHIDRWQIGSDNFDTVSQMQRFIDARR
jgi:acyl carrier protein